MKIGVITFHRSLNYGSVLQAYALQKLIQSHSDQYEVELIDYYPPGIEKIRSAFVPVSSAKNLMHNAAALFYQSAFNKRKKAFDNFLKKYIKVGNKVYTADSDMSDLDQKYDIVIAGSDQIWNNNTVDFSKKYFFPELTKARKAAYAPSMGNGNFSLPKDKDIYEMLRQFSFISVRELSGSEKLKKFLNDEREIPVVLDPTLLLNSEMYSSLEKEVKTKGKYIFLYSVKMDVRTLKIAQQISQKINLPIISLYTTNGSFRAYKYGIKLSGNSSPENFLRFIRDAELVVSDSFHGTAFSINYHKKFYSVCNKEASRRDARLDTILSNLQLQNRMLFFDDFERNDYLEEIDYSRADTALQKLRQESCGYLFDALK